MSAQLFKNTSRLNSPLYVQQSRLEFSLVEVYQGNPGNNSTRVLHNVYSGASEPTRALDIRLCNKVVWNVTTKKTTTKTTENKMM